MPEQATQPIAPAEPLPEYTLEELRELAYTLEQIDAIKLARTDPTTVAEFLSRLDVDERRVVLRRLTEPLASEILAEMDVEDSAEVVGAMREHRALKVVQSLAPDDAADLVGELKREDRDRLLKKLDPDEADTIRSLLKYKTDTAGGIMNPDVTTVKPDMTIEEAIEHIRKIKDVKEDIYYIYVVDKSERLIGVLPMRTIVLARPQQRIRDVMAVHLKGLCTPDLDREKVALMMAKLNLHALPVIDSQRRLVGIVTHDDVIDVLQDEAREDMQKLVGAGGNESVHDNVAYSLRHRTPWLAFNLLTAGLVSMVVNLFHEQIGIEPLLAIFMPIVAGLAGNTGQQTLAVMIRSLALDEIAEGEGFRLIMIEAGKGLMSGLLVGVAAYGLIWFKDPGIALVVMLALIVSMSLSSMTGAAIPLILKRLKFDPAQSSSIFLTFVTDCTGFAIFLGLGTVLLLASSS